MSAEKKASAALTRAQVVNKNIEVIMEFLKDLPMTLSLEHQQSEAYKRAFVSLQEKVN